jgi:hypothetical protein
MAAAQKKWALLSGPPGAVSGGGPVSNSPPDQLSSVSDVRVAPFVQSLWGQSAECGEVLPCTSGNPDVYNYYTPNSTSSVQPGNYNNYWSGCGATALAQIIRYFQYPTAGIGVHSLPYSVNGSQLTGKTLGGDDRGGPYEGL